MLSHPGSFLQKQHGFYTLAERSTKRNKHLSSTLLNPSCDFLLYQKLQKKKKKFKQLPLSEDLDCVCLELGLGGHLKILWKPHFFSFFFYLHFLRVVHSARLGIISLGSPSDDHVQLDRILLMTMMVIRIATVTAAFAKRHMQQIREALVWRGSPLARAYAYTHMRVCVYAYLGGFKVIMEANFVIPGRDLTRTRWLKEQSDSSK